MIRSCSLCARGVMARGSRYRLVSNSLAHNADGAKIMTSYQVISTRRQSRFVKKPKSKVRKKVDINTLFKPMSLSFPEEGAGAGIEIAGPMKEAEVEEILKKFYGKGEIRILAAENGLEGTLFEKVFLNFKKYCLNLNALPPDIYIRLKDISQGAGHPDDLFPYFLDHAKNIFPHLSCMEELKRISDLTTPANWYPEARASSRKIIYHGGPTNSGKTYHAIKRMFEAKTGIYCAPLKLLASEICHKSNAAGTPCDLITGEERRFAIPESPSEHLACTIEMASVTNRYEVAVIDEIQMIQDIQRGWAWTRALLGLNAEEIHLCGEESAVDLVKSLLADTLDEFEVKQYKRLSPLNWSNKSLGSITNVKPGDCIVCFSKRAIYTIRQTLERNGIRCAVLYGSLPPGAKLSEAARFNDPDNICKVLVATDAIGMGVNLSVRRIIFHKLIKKSKNIHGETEMEHLTTSQLLQIGGRAGRYGMDFDSGEVTTYKQPDIELLHKLKGQQTEPIKQAGLHPTAEQIETFAFHLPGSTLSELITIFEGICQLDGEKFFMCITDSFKMIAKMTEHIPLPLRTRYVICMSPINTNNSFLTSMILKFARRISNGEGVRVTWFRLQINWPYAAPKTTNDLEYLESVYDAMDLYLWLSYRFVDMFPDVHHIRDMREEVDLLIQNGVKTITKMTANESRIKLGSLNPEEMTENLFVRDNMESDETIDADESFKKSDTSENVTAEKEFDEDDIESDETSDGDEGFQKTYTSGNVTAEKEFDEDDIESDETSDGDEGFQKTYTSENVTAEKEFDEDDIESDEIRDGDKGFQNAYTSENVTAEKEFDKDDIESDEIRDGDEGFQKTYTLVNVTAEKEFDKNDYNKSVREKEENGFVTSVVTANNTKNHIGSTSVPYEQQDNSERNETSTWLKHKVPKIEYKKSVIGSRLRNKMSVPPKHNEPKIRSKKSIVSLIQSHNTSVPNEQQDKGGKTDMFPQKLKQHKVVNVKYKKSAIGSRQANIQRKEMSVPLKQEVTLASLTHNQPNSVPYDQQNNKSSYFKGQSEIRSPSLAYMFEVSSMGNKTASVSYEQQDNNERTDISGQQDNSERTDISGQQDNSERTDISGQQDNSERTDISGQQDNSERTDISGQQDYIEKTYILGQQDNSEKRKLRRKQSALKSTSSTSNQTSEHEQTTSVPSFASLRSNQTTSGPYEQQDNSEKTDISTQLKLNTPSNSCPSFATLMSNQKTSGPYEQQDNSEKTDISTQLKHKTPSKDYSSFESFRSNQTNTDPELSTHNSKFRRPPHRRIRSKLVTNSSNERFQSLVTLMSNRTIPVPYEQQNNNERTKVSTQKPKTDIKKSSASLNSNQTTTVQYESEHYVGSHDMSAPSKETESRTDLCMMRSESEHQNNNKRMELGKSSLLRQKSSQIEYKKASVLPNQNQQQNKDEMKDLSTPRTEDDKKDRIKVEDRITNADTQGDTVKKKSVLSFIRGLFSGKE